MQLRKAPLIPSNDSEIIWLVFMMTTIGGRKYGSKGRDGYPADFADAIIWLFGAVRGFI
jgi:hypothetical protein